MHRFARYTNGKLSGDLGQDRERTAASSIADRHRRRARRVGVVSDTMNNRIQKFDVPPASAAAEK
jgi:hypothetical protein